MARIKGTGVPTRKTKGSMGDIYTDTKTGKMYECVFAYRNGSDNMFDCQWVEIHDAGTTQKVEEVKPVVDAAKLEEPKQEVKSEIEPEKIPEEKIEETKEEKPAANRTNYTAYSKQNK